ncbi:MAG: hypothetical protein LBK00_03540 [Treponema sp.]|nr:hypothetical protein [Treponema sp.]
MGETKKLGEVFTCRSTRLCTLKRIPMVSHAAGSGLPPLISGSDGKAFFTFQVVKEGVVGVHLIKYRTEELAYTSKEAITAPVNTLNVLGGCRNYLFMASAKVCQPLQQGEIQVIGITMSTSTSKGIKLAHRVSLWIDFPAPQMSSNTTCIAKNTLMLYLRQILVMLVNLYTVRVVLNTLDRRIDQCYTCLLKTEAGMIKDDFDFYYKNQEMIANGHIGKYAVIRDAQVYGYFDTEDTVFIAMKMETPGTFMVKKCRQRGEDIITYHTRRVWFA